MTAPALGRICGGLLLLGALAFAPSALAADWSGTFPVDPVDSHLQGDELKLVVVGGGEATDELKAAVDALSGALREAASVEIVMDATAIGDTAGLDDQAIVKKAGNLPVDQVAVVRVFPGKGGAFSAVVTMYAKDGTAKGGFSAGTDKPTEAAASGGLGSRGSATGMDPGAAIGAVVNNDNAEMQAKFDEYLERRVFFQGMAAVSAETGAVMSTWSVPYKGKYREPLPGPKFYDYVGQPSVAKEVRKRRTIKTVVGLTSTGLLIGGMTGMLRAATMDTYVSSDCWEEETDEEQEECEEDDEDEQADLEEEQKQKVVRNAVISGVGFVGIYVPLFIKSDPTPVSERYKMADEYNARLREELGLPDDLSGFKSGTDYGMRVYATGSAGPNGASAGFTVEW